MHIPALFLLACLALLHLGAALIPSLGQRAAQAVRSPLPDRAFLLRNGRPQLTSPNFRANIFEAANTPALAATDTQMFVATTHVKAGKKFIKHYHPRAAEILYVIRGRMRSQFWFEGANPRVVTNILRRTDSVVYPQGLVHEVQCISRRDCTFVAVLNSGDPGFNPAL